MTTRPSGLQLSASVFAMENNQDLRVSKSGTHIHRCFKKKSTNGFPTLNLKLHC